MSNDGASVKMIIQLKLAEDSCVLSHLSQSEIMHATACIFLEREPSTANQPAGDVGFGYP